jgi:hypothetical protein
MEGRYPSGIRVVLADCVEPSREAAFNEWYEKTRIPAMEALDFVRYTRRYENVLSGEATFRGRPKYLALSEIYRADVGEALNEMRRHDALLPPEARGFDGIVTKLDAIYEWTGPEFRSDRTGRPVRLIGFLLPGCTDTRREDEFNAWYNQKHSPETIETGLWDTAYRYRAVDVNDPVFHHTTRYVAIYESSESLDLSARQEKIRKKQQQDAREDAQWLELLEVYYTGLFRPIYS